MTGKPRDRVGEVYGRLTIISISDKRSKSGSSYWNGKCECGQMRFDIPGDHLFHGIRKNRKSVSCCMDCARQLQSAATIQLNTSSEKKRRQDAIERRENLIGVVAADLLLLPLTKQDARENNSPHFFNGLPCPEGHLDRRRVDGGCAECSRLRKAARDATEEGKEKNRAYSNKRWADPKVRARLQAERSKWAKTPEGKASLRKSFVSFYAEHRDRLMTEHAARQRQRTRSDPVFKLRRNLGSRIRLALKNQQTTKDSTTMALVGCDLNSFVDFMESQFEEWMSWENMGDWHVDHVRPCASFDLSVPEQQVVCFNWRNLQPLDGDENYEKRDCYDKGDEDAWVERMQALGFEGNLFLVYGIDG